MIYYIETKSASTRAPFRRMQVVEGTNHVEADLESYVRARLRRRCSKGVDLLRMVVYLHAADKDHRFTRRLSQEQTGLDERAIMASQWPSHPW